MKNFILAGFIGILASCSQSDIPTSVENNIEVYAQERARLITGMSKADVIAELGDPFFEEMSQDGAKHCILVAGTSSDNRAILHDVFFEDDELVDHIVGLDLGTRACAVTERGN